jgi:hypothetical protein
MRLVVSGQRVVPLLGVALVFALPLVACREGDVDRPRSDERRLGSLGLRDMLG